MKNIIFTCSTFVLMLSDCKKDENASDPNPTYEGVEKTIGNGKVYS